MYVCGESNWIVVRKFSAVKEKWSIEAPVLKE
jgi:hypothetical protein